MTDAVLCCAVRMLTVEGNAIQGSQKPKSKSFFGSYRDDGPQCVAGVISPVAYHVIGGKVAAVWQVPWSWEQAKHKLQGGSL